MKKIMTTALSLLAMSAMAQETYESAQLATQDLNGTAKYIGMGGAMEALGADISTINTNPAGIGMFRRSWVGMSAGFTSQSGSYKPDYGNISGRDNGKTNVDLNQLGFVLNLHSTPTSAFNLAFNYQKSRNFNQILQAMNSLDANSSASKMNAMKSLGQAESYTLQDELLFPIFNELLRDNATDNNPYYSNANAYAAYRNNKGYISNFDVNISGNANNKVYLGLTVGIKDVNYKSDNTYFENLVTTEGIDRGTMGFQDYREISGTGIDIKFGAIIRPIEYSPFRFGLYINTPTWYELQNNGFMYADATLHDKGKQNANADYSYKYCISTPWRFGVSAAHTFGNKLAIGATYEYADYSTINNKIVDGEYINDYGNTSLETHKDYYMNKNTERALKGVSLLKVGAEFKPNSLLAIRVGYNHQSAIYATDGYKDSFMPTYFFGKDVIYDGSVGNYYSTYDYVNWGATNRVTCGVGFNISKNFAVDLAYQYATQKGEYNPFNHSEVQLQNELVTNHGTPTEVKNDRHQFNVTVGYRF